MYFCCCCCCHSASQTIGLEWHVLLPWFNPSAPTVRRHKNLSSNSRLTFVYHWKMAKKWGDTDVNKKFNYRLKSILYATLSARYSKFYYFTPFFFLRQWVLNRDYSHFFWCTRLLPSLLTRRMTSITFLKDRIVSVSHIFLISEYDGFTDCMTFCKASYMTTMREQENDSFFSFINYRYYERASSPT